MSARISISFFSDPQYLGYLSPRLNSKAESLTQNYIEQASSLKLFFPEGEIDFVVSGYLTKAPAGREELPEFTARDIFDLALVTEKEPRTLEEIRPFLRDRRDVILQRVSAHEAALREAFAALEVLDYRRTFDECIALLRKAFR